MNTTNNNTYVIDLRKEQKSRIIQKLYDSLEHAIDSNYDAKEIRNLTVSIYTLTTMEN